jgi:Amidases related to nicotinamidase
MITGCCKARDPNFDMKDTKKPLKLQHSAVLVVDMLNDFVTGALACDRGKAIVPATAQLLDAAREAGIPVIFCNDAHIKGVDLELKLWGDHAIEGTKGAKVIPELKAGKGDYIIPKRRYSGFFQTNLDILLRELGVDTVIMTGLHAHMCVRHTSADAYQLGYNVVVAKEATDSFTEEDYNIGIAYLKTCYGADAYSNAELIKAMGKLKK